ncbi:alkaline phosphatase [Patulibacter sp.]|uniref:alkaline phosphatase n=1 Tax=Patulibacter sp. TaxID=1912859 RepID=UPI00271F7C0C|nr:alkaline phosphatase [Patulibacter sp.]MDO9410119.1 alkaline phosphatase [Patulibacter sp.]
MPTPRIPRGRRPLIAAAAAVAVVAGGGATALAVTSDTTADRSAGLAAQINPATPKNVILLVGDGMGESEVSIARYYQGVDKPLNMDRLPFRGVATTYDLTPLDDVATQGKINFDPDSASTATAWSTGQKTQINRLGQGNSANRATPGPKLETTIEAAKKLGKWTGNVTTAEVTDATPAGPTAHVSQRACQGPADTRSTCPTEAKIKADGTANAGALGSVAEQQVDLRPDITFGAGRARFQQTLSPLGNKTVVDKATEDGFQYVTTKTQMDGLSTLGDKPGAKPILGLFHDGTEVDKNTANMVTEWKGQTAAVANVDGNPDTCDTTHREKDAPQEPALSEMSAKALSLLDKQQGDKGFFLQVEGASIDKRDHAANPCEQIGETLQFDKAIGQALDYQSSHPDTLVIVTADHSHSSQIVSASPITAPTGANNDDVSKQEAPTGYFRTLTTPDGSKLRISYGTNGGNTTTHVPASGAPSQQHTGAAVPVMAVGPQAANITGTIDQTDLFPLLTFRRVPSKLPSGTTTVPGPTTTVAGPTTTVPGPTTTVTGPTTTVPAPVRLTAGVAVPRRLTSAVARKGVPVSILSSKSAKVVLTLKRGSTTISRTTVQVPAGGTKNVTLSGRKLRAKRSATLKLTAVATSGKESVTRRATISVSK